jgi:hypothetical protein
MMMRILCVLITLVFCCGSASAQLTYEKLMVDYDNAWTYKNLKLIPIRPKGLPGNGAQGALVSLRDALQQGLVKVEERGTASIDNVHFLSLYNQSDKNVFIQSGELLQGGRQDRMISKDTISLAHSGRIDLQVMCVEEGRWSEKTKPFQHQGMAAPSLKKVLDVSHNQVLIWKEIDNQLTEDSIHAKSLAYLAQRNDKKYTAEQKAYVDFFKKQLAASDSNIVGVVAVSGNRVLGAEIFVGAQTFLGSAEAIAASFSEQAIIRGAPPFLNNEGVRKYLDQFMRNQSQQDEWLQQKNGKKFTWKGRTIHITAY